MWVEALLYIIYDSTMTTGYSICVHIYSRNLGALVIVTYMSVGMLMVLNNYTFICDYWKCTWCHSHLDVAKYILE